MKSFLNQEYIGDAQTFDSTSVRPFIKAKNVIEEIYKSLFQMRGHGAVDSVAKTCSDDVKEKLNNMKERIDVIIEPLKAKLKDLEHIKRAEEAFILEQKAVYYLDQNIADPSGNKDKTIMNVNKAVNQIKSKIENSNINYLETNDSAHINAALTGLFTFMNDGDTAAGSEKACDFMIDALRTRIVN